MKNKKRLLGMTLAVAVTVVIGVWLSGDRLSGRVTIEGFVYDPCGGCFADNNPCKPCTVVMALEQYLYNQLDAMDKRQSCTVAVYNLLDSQNQTLLAELLPTESPSDSYPILLVDGVVFSGWDEIEKGFAGQIAEKTRRFWQAPIADNGNSGEAITLIQTTQAAVVYFGMKTCRSCNSTKELLANLDDGSFRLVEYNIEQPGSLEIFDAYCTQYGLESGTATVPVVFIGDKALDSFEAIELFLPSYLEDGKADGTYVTQ